MSILDRIAPQSARLSADGAKIILGPGPPEWSEFCQSLPRAKWNQLACCWTCDFTPAAAWRIAGRAGEYYFLDDEARWVKAGIAFGQALSSAQHLDVASLIPTKTTPWGHQVRGFYFSYWLPSALLAMDMGTGKTLNAIALMLAWNCQTTLILCPLSVRGVWRREIERHAGRPIRTVILEKGSTKEKTQQADRALESASRRGEPLAVVVNYDTAKLNPFADWSLRQQWDCVICDESHRIKAHNSAVSKYAAKLFYVSKRRLCLTGTPLGQSPLDLFGQFRFLDPGLFGTSWHHFSNRYAIKGNPYIPQQITGYKNQEELQQRFHLITYRCKASDVLDLPPVMHEERMCELSPEAKRHYRELENELITDVGNGKVVAANALVRLLRLQQVTSGFLQEEGPTYGAGMVLDMSGKIHRIDEGKAKLLEDLLEDAGGDPFVVFCRFREDLRRVELLAKSLELTYGELSGGRKDALTPDATMADVQVAGVQIASGGVGVDLSRARYAAYYSLGFSLTEYEQSLARLHRPGQTQSVVYYHLQAEGTVDRRVYGALRARKQVIEAVLEEYQSEDSQADQRRGQRRTVER